MSSASGSNRLYLVLAGMPNILLRQQITVTLLLRDFAKNQKAFVHAGTCLLLSCHLAFRD